MENGSQLRRGRAIFGEDLGDGRAPSRGVAFTKDVVKIAGQQDGYAGHGVPPIIALLRVRKGESVRNDFYRRWKENRS